MSIAFAVCAAITLISALISFGFSFAALRKAGTARDLALYALSRSFVLVGLAVVPVFSGDLAWLEAAAFVMIMVQGFDAIIGQTRNDALKTFGPAGVALANLAALVWLTQTLN